jgi:hypothetical protein
MRCSRGWPDGVTAVLLALVWSCALPATGAGAAPALAPLRAVGVWSTYSYSLPSLRSCEVGDGLSLVKVAGPTALRVTNVQVLYGNDFKSRWASVTYELISFRRGTTEGQLAASFKLGALGNGLTRTPAIGGELKPLMTSQLWYDIVALVKVTVNRAASWSIDGLRVSYRSGSTTNATILRQSVKLPMTQFCASS